jgi:hypothetical protein
MTACITAMKQTNPIYVSLMLDAMYGEE